MKKKSLSFVLTLAIGLAGLVASHADAKPPSQVPSGYQAYLDKKKSSPKACCKDGSVKAKKVAVGEGRDTPKPFYKQRRGGGGYSVNR